MNGKYFDAHQINKRDHCKNIVQICQIDKSLTLEIVVGENNQLYHNF